MLHEQRRFRKYLFWAAFSIELAVIAFTSQRGQFLPNIYFVWYPLFLILVIRPFDFFHESVVIRDNHVVRMIRGRVAEMVPINEIVSVEGRSILGMIPLLTLKGEHGRLDIPLMLPGALKVEAKLKNDIVEISRLGEFFRYYRILARENSGLWKSLTIWLQWYFLFGLITPLLLWEQGAYLSIYWMFLTLGGTIFALVVLKLVHHLVLSLSIDWADKYLVTIRHWGLFVFFLLYLLNGIRFYP